MSTGFTFGAKTTAAPTFGTSSLPFGGATSQPQSTGFSFGSTPAAAGGAPSLFGSPASVPATTTSLFGPSPSTGLFAPPANTSAPNLSFGPSPAATTVSTGLSFGIPTTTTTPAPTFGLTSGQPPASAVTGSVLPTISTSAAPMFGFGLPATTTSTLKLGAPQITTTTANLSFGLGGMTSAVTTATSLTTVTSTPQRIGLGGVANASQAKSSNVATQKEVPPKDQPLPNEILQTVETFKEMVKKQKCYSTDISRCSVRDFRNVEQEIDQLSYLLNEVENQVQKNRQIAEKLKYDTAKTVQNVELAQRTHDTPPGLQYENTAPMKFFLNLADQFENEMLNLKIQIEAADKYVKNHRNPDSLSQQDLAIGMRRLHETFVALAGRLQSVHAQVESQKETYLNIRKRLLQDTSNPFDKLAKTPEFQVSDMRRTFINSPPKVATGPTPFNNLAFRTASLGAPQQHTTPPPAYPGPSGSGGSGFGATGFGASLGATQPSNTSLFGSTGFGQSSVNNSFQLQKPPTGNKRGKV